MSSRVSRALPVLGVFTPLAVLYLVEALLHHSPWIFFDELNYSMNARRIADLATQPGAKPFHFDGLYSFLIAPAWLADNVHTAYWASKTIGVLVMTAAAFPAYWLARTLAVSRPIAVFVAAGTVAVPALSYTSSLMTETLAYPYAILCFALIVRALATRSRGWVVGAVVASVLAPVVRKELAVIPAAFAVAGLAYFGVPWLGRSRSRWAAAVVAACAALAVLAWGLTHVSATWSEAAGHPLRMIAYARAGAGSVIVGLALLPAIAGLAALVRPRGEPSKPERRAFVCLFAAAGVTFLLYTAAKGVYLGPLANPVEERNLIYLVPLLLGGTGMWLARRRVDPVALVAATGLVLWLAVTVPLHLGPTPASDAPSLEILGTLGWGPPAVHGLLAGFAVLAALVVLVRPVRLLVGACALVLVWSLASEIYASHRSADYASRLAAAVPRPLEWITQATGGRPSAYVGQEILQPSDIWLQSFWNPSLVLMRSLDGTPGGTGPLKSYHGIPATGDILRIQVGRQGALPLPAGIGFLVGDRGITGAGRLLATGERWHVYTGTRLRSAALGVYSDGWMGARSTFSVFNGSEGSVRVRLSRSNWCGRDVPGRTRIFLNGSPRAYTIVHACKTVEATVPTPTTPFRIETAIHPTFSPAALDPSYPDKRQLGAVVTYIYGP